MPFMALELLFMELFYFLLFVELYVYMELLFSQSYQHSLSLEVGMFSNVRLKKTRKTFV